MLLTKGVKVFEIAVGAVCGQTRFSLARVSIRDLVVRNSGVEYGGQNWILSKIGLRSVRPHLCPTPLAQYRISWLASPIPFMSKLCTPPLHHLHVWHAMLLMGKASPNGRACGRWRYEGWSMKCLSLSKHSSMMDPSLPSLIPVSQVVSVKRYTHCQEFAPKGCWGPTPTCMYAQFEITSHIRTNSSTATPDLACNFALGSMVGTGNAGRGACFACKIGHDSYNLQFVGVMTQHVQPNKPTQLDDTLRKQSKCPPDQIR